MHGDDGDEQSAVYPCVSEQELPWFDLSTDLHLHDGVRNVGWRGEL